jgi:hypothetical protein
MYRPIFASSSVTSDEATNAEAAAGQVHPTIEVTSLHRANMHRIHPQVQTTMQAATCASSCTSLLMLKHISKPPLLAFREDFLMATSTFFFSASLFLLSFKDLYFFWLFFIFALGSHIFSAVDVEAAAASGTSLIEHATEIGTGTEIKTEIGIEIEIETELEIGIGIETEIEIEIGIGIETEIEIGIEIGTEAEAGPGPGIWIETATVTGTAEHATVLPIGVPTTITYMRARALLGSETKQFFQIDVGWRPLFCFLFSNARIKQSNSLRNEGMLSDEKSKIAIPLDSWADIDQRHPMCKPVPSPSETGVIALKHHPILHALNHAYSLAVKKY